MMLSHYYHIYFYFITCVEYMLNMLIKHYYYGDMITFFLVFLQFYFIFITQKYVKIRKRNGNMWCENIKYLYHFKINDKFYYEN